MKNKRWKREAKRIYGECHKHYECTYCKKVISCINKTGWGGCFVSLREVEKRIKKHNLNKKVGKE